MPCPPRSCPRVRTRPPCCRRCGGARAQGSAFTDPAEARVLVASDPTGPCGVTVTTSTVMGALWLTAEFHDSVFDATQIGRALEPDFSTTDRAADRRETARREGVSGLFPRRELVQFFASSYAINAVGVTVPLLVPLIVSPSWAPR